MRSQNDSRSRHEAWVTTRERSLRDPEGWLSLVALHWLPTGRMTVLASSGVSSETCLVLPGAPASPTARFLLEDTGSLRVTIPSGVQATIDGDAMATETPIIMRSDEAPTASILRSGRLHVTHIHRQDRSALRVRDREAPTLMRHRGVPRFDFDPEHIVSARFVPANPGTTIPITLITEHVEAHPVKGTLHFELDGRPLSMLAQPSGEDLFVVFGDQTNQAPGDHGTYGGGRFLSVPRPDRNGLTTIDFNRAVNPPCSFTPHATCPTPPTCNRLPLPVTAGERRPS